jgi:hypothetical protein
MSTLNAEITGLPPGKLWIIRLACRMAGATLKVWKARKRLSGKLLPYKEETE